MVPVEQFVGLALKQTGDDYVFGVEDSKNLANPSAFDCSELVQWCCDRLNVEPKMPDGAFYQWQHTHAISVAAGIRTRGALLFVGDGVGVGRDAITHVAISLGDGKTIEARGRRWGVGSWEATGRFSYAGRVPGIDYGLPPIPPSPIRPVPPITKDKPMVIHLAKTDRSYLALSGHLLKIGSQSEVTDHLKALGQPAVVTLNQDEFDRLKAVAPVI